MKQLRQNSSLEKCYLKLHFRVEEEPHPHRKSLEIEVMKTSGQ